jgi:hypothetical protein
MSGHTAIKSANWLAALRAYLGVTAIANLLWEMLHLPLYGIWTTGSVGQKAFAVLHCTAGDVLIALAAFVAALTTVGTKAWPTEHHRPVLFVTLIIGVAYTIFSEWLNIVIRASWAYSPLMPVIPIIKTGLSPLLQWFVIPAVALHVARRAADGN